MPGPSGEKPLNTYFQPVATALRRLLVLVRVHESFVFLEQARVAIFQVVRIFEALDQFRVAPPNPNFDRSEARVRPDIPPDFADALYGVTMSADGTSKLVSLKLE